MILPGHTPKQQCNLEEHWVLYVSGDCTFIFKQTTAMTEKNKKIYLAESHLGKTKT